MRFCDIPGHDDVKERLRSMIKNGRMPHALLLEGNQGIGKFALLRAFAQYIHCENPSDEDSCGVCPSCLRHQSFNHIDTHFSFPVVKGKSSSEAPVSDDCITQWRDFLKADPYMRFDNWVKELGNPTTKPVFYVTESESLSRKLSFTTHGGSLYKIVLLWLPERMNEQTANKLLKLIEEPFEDTVFLLSSDESAKILPTIYSRCQRIKVRPLPENILAEELMKRGMGSRQDALAVARLARGSVSEAEHLLDDKGRRTEDFSAFVSLMRMAYQRKIAELRDWSQNLAALPRTRQIEFLEFCVGMMRENFLYNLGDPDLIFLNSDEAAFSKNFARFITSRNVLKLRRAFSDAITDIAGNANSKFVFFDLSIRVILLLK